MDVKYGPPLRVFKNGKLRKIFGPKIKKSKAGWKILHSEEIHDLYSLSGWMK
jgi:hypothetical protein